MKRLVFAVAVLALAASGYALAQDKTGGTTQLELRVAEMTWR
jgi:hypothetical protein